MSRNNLVLLIIGCLILAKALWILISPASFRKAAAWWLAKIKHVNTLTGYLYIVIGTLLIALVLLDQKLVDGVLVGLGALAIYSGAWMFNIENVEKKVNGMVINRGSIALRIMGVVGFVLAGLVIFVAISKPVG